MRKPKPKAKSRNKNKSGQKPGGQPGNKNALRHGFYSKQFTDEQNKRLQAADNTSLESEIDLIRICLDRLYKQIDMEPIYQTGKDADGLPIQTEIRDDHYLKQLNTLSLMTQSLSTTVRTQHLIKGKSSGVLETITNALEEMRIELGL